MHEHNTIAGHLGPVATGLLQTSTIDAATALAAPGDVFRRPHEVARHPSLSLSEKRAILASWASDAHAVETCPTLRCLPGCRAEVVAVDEVFAALQALDTRDISGAIVAAPPPNRPPMHGRPVGAGRSLH